MKMIPIQSRARAVPLKFPFVTGRRRIFKTGAATLLFLSIILSASAATNFVKMVNFAFDPKFLTNEPGDTIIWTNTTLTGHNVVSSNNAWAAPALFTMPGTFKVTLTTPGTYGYYCSPHRSFGMTGIIYVRAPGQPPIVSLTNSSSAEANALALTVRVTPGSTYDVDGSTNLSDWLVVTNFTATEPVKTLSIPTTVTERKFFRARLLPNP